MNDSWFNWLENDFLKYHSEWKKTLTIDKANFQKMQKNAFSIRGNL